MIAHPLSLIFPEVKKWAEIKLTNYAKRIKAGKETHWLKELESDFNAVLYGGYMENRAVFFDERHQPNAVTHLGLDVWLPTGITVLSPVNGIVSDSTPPSDTIGGWGGRVDVETEQGILIFGHLAAPTLVRGTKVHKGDILGYLGSRDVNGGWLPHLHLQGVNTFVYKRFHLPRDIDAYSEPYPKLSVDFPHPFLYF